MVRWAIFTHAALNLGNIPHLGGRLLAAAAMLALPAVAWANQPPVVDSFTASPATVAPGGTVTLTVQAHDPDCSGTCTSGCGQYIRSDLTVWTAPQGTLTSIDNGTSGSPYTATAEWQAPDAAGSYTVAISLSDSGSFMCGGRESTSATVTISVATSAPPVISSLTATPSRLFPGESSLLVAVASDPDGDPISYSWSADVGTVTPGGDGTATFSAPASPAVATVTCTATDPAGASSSRDVTIVVTGAEAEFKIGGPFLTPHRLAGDAEGELFVVDRSSNGLWVANLFSRRVVGYIPYTGVRCVAVDWNGRLVVGGSFGARVIGRDGSTYLTLVPPGVASDVTDVAADTVGMRYGVLDGGAGSVRIFDDAGHETMRIGTTGSSPDQLLVPLGLAFGPAGQIVVGDTGHGMVKIFAADGSFQTAFGGLGGGAGDTVQLEDVDVGPNGVVYVVDAFQDWVQAFDMAGNLLEAIGTYGDDVGQFKTSTGVTVLGGLGRLVVASNNTPSLEVFRLDRSVPPGPAAVLSRAAVAFGEQAVGSTSPAVQIHLTNVGTLPVAVYGAETTGDFSVSSGCGDTLAVGQSCAYSVTFTPTVPGERNGELVVDAGVEGGPLRVVLTGEGFLPGQPVLTVTPPALSFADTLVGTSSAPQVLRLSNTGSSRLYLQGFATGGDYVATSACGPWLDPAEDCAVQVVFSPSASGPREGTLTILDSSPGAPHTVSLTGTGLGPALALSPVTTEFGSVTVGSTSTARVISLTNVGNLPLTLSSVVASGDFAAVSGCPATLDPGRGCSVEVTFTPTRTGVRSGVLTVFDNAPGNPHTVVLKGIGAGAELVLSSTALDFGSAPVGTTGATRSLTVTSVGSSDLHVAQLTLGSASPDDFVPVVDECSGATLPPGHLCRILLEFHPSEEGRRLAMLTIPSDAVGGRRDVPLSGLATTGQRPPQLVLIPASIDFGAVKVHETGGPATVVVRNEGEADLVVGAVTVGGASPGEFAIVEDHCSNATVAGGESCWFSVSFAPSRVGIFTAQVTVPSNDPAGTATLPLSGEGVHGSWLSASPASLQFPATPVGSTSGGQTVVIENIGTASLTIAPISIGGADAGDFVLEAESCSGAVLAPGATCSVTVRFVPMRQGLRQASITVSDAGDTDAVEVGLTGNGVVAAIPTLSEWGLVILVGWMILAGILEIRRRSGS